MHRHLQKLLLITLITFCGQAQGAALERRIERPLTEEDDREEEYDDAPLCGGEGHGQADDRGRRLDAADREEDRPRPVDRLAVAAEALVVGGDEHQRVVHSASEGRGAAPTRAKLCSLPEAIRL